MSFADNDSAPLHLTRRGRVTNVNDSALRDNASDVAFESLIEVLETTGEFAQVMLGGRNNDDNPVTSCYPKALIVPENWIETDYVQSNIIIRRINFRLIITVRELDPLRRLSLLEALVSTSQRAVDGSSLGGGCLASLTRIHQGNYGITTNYPEQGIELLGTFSYPRPVQSTSP
jgi:hypothetical protein